MSQGDIISNQVPKIEKMWLDWKERKIKQYPQNNLRASSIGHPCERFHYYSIKSWKEKPMHDAVLQSIFDEGELHEKALIQELQNMGLDIVEQQKSFQLDSPLITGHIDGIIRWDNQSIPFDIKTISPFDFQKMNTAKDFLDSKKIHQRNYVAQIQLYLLMSDNPLGCLILKNKLTGQIKVVWVTIDYEFCEAILKRASSVYQSIDNSKEPERISDSDYCSDCSFHHLCLPDLKLESSVKFLENEDLLNLLHQREEAKESAKVFKETDKKIKELTVRLGEGEKICGDYLIKVKEQVRKRKIPLTYEEESQRIYQTQIIKIDGHKKDRG